jgi:hypothetical protein
MRKIIFLLPLFSIGFYVKAQRVGIGTNNPDSTLDVRGNIGYGNSGTFTEKFRMKGNGAFVVNGSTGTTGQVLKSNGSGTAPNWSSVLNNQIVKFESTGSVTFAPGSSVALIPGWSYSFTLTEVSKVKVDVITRGYSSGSNSVLAVLEIYINNIIESRIYEDVTVGGKTISGNDLFILNPGNYTIEIKGGTGCSSGCNSVTLAFNATAGVVVSHMIVQIIPQ